jgi:hypothetical protein
MQLPKPKETKPGKTKDLNNLHFAHSRLNNSSFQIVAGYAF